MRQVRWSVVFLVGVGAMGWAAAPAAKKDPPKAEKPKDSFQLPGTDSVYYLDVPEGLDPKEPCPLVVVFQNAPDQAKQTFDAWVPRLKPDHVFVALLAIPAQKNPDDVRYLMENRLPKMMAEIHKNYENARQVALVGSGGGAQEVMKFVAGLPGYFRVAVAISPDGFPDLPKKYNSMGRTELLVTLPKPPKPTPPDKPEKMDKDSVKARKDAAAKAADAAKKTNICIETLKNRIIFRGQSGEGFGANVSDKEKDLALQMIETCFSDAKRHQIADARKGVVGEKPVKDEKDDTKGKEQPKTAKAEEPKPEPTPKAEPGKELPKPVEARSADDIQEEANKLEQTQKYSSALKAYEQLARVKPGSDYERFALKKIEELKRNPVVRRFLADEAADKAGQGEAKRSLSAARNLEGANQPDKAASKCKEIISKYPDTSYADEARKILDRLEASK